MASALPLIEIERLTPGMYIVLDVGWRNHPFLRSSFTLRGREQIAELHALGLTHVRWCPDRSSARPLPERPPQPAPPDDVDDGTLATDSAAGRRQWPAADPPTETEWRARALQRLEADYGDITGRHRALLQSIDTEPQRTRRGLEQLGEQLFDTVLRCDLPGVRLLSPQVGQQSSGHDIGVAVLSLLVARDCGFSDVASRELALAALLHDVGKATLPAHCREDGPRLTELERRLYRRHVELGVDAARSMELPRAVVRAIAEHHERVDGSGFPAGLSGEQITPAARVLAVVNRYLNLVYPLHHPGLTPFQALQQMYAGERAHFDAGVLSRFVRVMGVYPPGSLVELSDQRLALVLSSRPGASLAPRVQVLGRIDADGEPGDVIDIDPAGPLRVQASVNPARLNPMWAERARQLARAPLYVEPQTLPEWGAWATTDAELILEY